MFMLLTHREGGYSERRPTVDALLVNQEGRKHLVAELGCLESLHSELLAEAEIELTSEVEATWHRWPRSYELKVIDREIKSLRRALADSVHVAGRDSLVAVGTRVTIEDDEGVRELTLVGPVEANPFLNLVSYSSPLAKAIMGRGVGDEVEVVSSDEVKMTRIIAIRSMSLDARGSAVGLDP